LAELYISSDFESHNTQPSTEHLSIYQLELHLHLWCWRRMCCGERKARETESVAENWSLGPTVAKDTEAHTDRHGQTQVPASSSPQELASLRTRQASKEEGLGRPPACCGRIKTINQFIGEKEASSIGNHPNNQHVISSAPAGEGGTP
jgi:hypothetical protein